MNVSLKFYIAFKLIELFSKEMGYHFSDDRIARIADSSLRLGNRGYATLLSTAVAFELDLLLYGDPKAPVMFDSLFEPVMKEIYGEDYGTQRQRKDGEKPEGKDGEILQQYSPPKTS